MLRKLYLLKNN